jgi:hypothetical protein
MVVLVDLLGWQAINQCIYGMATFFDVNVLASNVGEFSVHIPER